jgi:hypothetical protein
MLEVKKNFGPVFKCFGSHFAFVNRTNLSSFRMAAKAIQKLDKKASGL